MTPKSTDSVDVEVGQRIRIQRLQSRLSQTSLAEQLGVTFQQVQKYEKGVNRVGAGRLTKIANVLGIPVSTFFGAHDATTIARSDRGTASSPLKLLTVPGALRNSFSSRSWCCATSLRAPAPKRIEVGKEKPEMLMMDSVPGTCDSCRGSGPRI